MIFSTKETLLTPKLCFVTILEVFYIMTRKVYFDNDLVIYDLDDFSNTPPSIPYKEGDNNSFWPIRAFDVKPPVSNLS